MRPIRRKTRETLRHERAVVRQQLGADADAAGEQAFIATNKRKAAKLAADAQKRNNRETAK